MILSSKKDAKGLNGNTKINLNDFFNQASKQNVII